MNQIQRELSIYQQNKSTIGFLSYQLPFHQNQVCALDTPLPSPN